MNDKPTKKVFIAAIKTGGGPVRHVENVPVVETFRVQIMWDGIVEVYETINAPLERIYGWTEGEGDKTQFVTIKGTPPINSPLDAVRAWLVSLARK